MFLDYELTGSGECVVLIHGLSENKSIWREQVPAFARYFSVLAYDVRGHGGSDVGDEQGTPKLFADDLAGLLTALHIPEAHIVGFSMGGVIALQFAIDYPHMAKSIVIVSSSSVCNAAAAQWYYDGADRAEREGLGATSRRDVERCFAPEIARLKPQLIEQYIELRQAADPRGYANASRAMADLYKHPITSDLKRITCPTLVLTGEQDAVCPPKASRIIHANLPGSLLKIVEGRGHCIFLEDPEGFNRIILDFLGSG